MEQDGGRELGTVNRSFDIIRALEALEGAGVTELAEEIGLSKGAVHTHLNTLRANDVVVKDENVYRLGLRFITFGEFVKRQRSLYEAGQDEIDELAESTGEYAHLMVEERGRGFHIYKGRGENAVGQSYHDWNLQKADHLHYSAAGKSILSCLDPDHVHDIFDTYGLPKRTEQTITDRAELFDELELIQNRGYAINDEEEIEGLRAVGAPIETDDEIGAVSVSGPVSRMKEEWFINELPEQVMQSANVIELNVETATF